MFPPLLALAFALVPQAAASRVEHALAVHLPPAGLARIGDAVAALVPASLPVTDLSGEFPCDDTSDPLGFHLDALDLRMAAEEVAVVPGDGRLDLSLVISLQSTAAALEVAGDCVILVDLQETCTVELPVTALTVDLGLALALVDGALDATVDRTDVGITPVGNPLSGCSLEGVIGTLLLQDEGAISALLLDLVAPELEGLGATIEESVEGLLTDLVVEQPLDLLGSTVQLLLEPSDFRVDTNGLLLGFGIDVAPLTAGTCVSLPPDFTPASDAWPPLDDTAFDTSLPYDLGILINKDLGDLLGWGLAASGALCLDVAALDLGLDLTTDFLATLLGDAFKELFPENQTVNLTIAPSKAPTVHLSDDVPQLALALDGLGIEVVAELDDRSSRVLRVDLLGDVGIDPGIGPTAIAPQLLIDPEGLAFVEVANELLPPGVGAGFSSLVPLMLDLVLTDDLLPSLAVPSLMGIGLDAVVWVTDVPAQWLGGFVLLDLDGVQPLEIPGCEGGTVGCDGASGFELDIEELLGCSGQDPLGCDEASAGCEGSCASGGRSLALWPAWRLLLALGALGLVGLRRR